MLVGAEKIMFCAIVVGDRSYSENGRAVRKFYTLKICLPNTQRLQTIDNSCPISHRNFNYKVTFKIQKKNAQNIRQIGIMSSTAHSDAFTVQGTKGKGPGRSLASRKTFKPGDLIATFTSPILVLPNGPSAKIVCNHCLAHNVPTKACTGCKAVVYCGAACQKANWGLIHKLECKVFKRVKASADQDWLPTPVRALVQVLLRWDTDEGLRAAFGRLEGNVDRFRSREDVWKDVGLQAYGGMAYAGRKETDNELNMARDILCKVSKDPERR